MIWEYARARLEQILNAGLKRSGRIRTVVHVAIKRLRGSRSADQVKKFHKKHPKLGNRLGKTKKSS